MPVSLYIRKNYFRGVTLSDKSAHILYFDYKGEFVHVYENETLIFRLQYFLENRFKAEIKDFCIPNIGMRGKGYGSVCMIEILSELKRKGVSLIKTPLGYELAPIGYTGPDQYLRLMAEFFEKTGFSINGDGDAAVQILA